MELVDCKSGKISKSNGEKTTPALGRSAERLPEFGKRHRDDGDGPAQKPEPAQKLQARTKNSPRCWDRAK